MGFRYPLRPPPSRWTVPHNARGPQITGGWGACAMTQTRYFHDNSIVTRGKCLRRRGRLGQAAKQQDQHVQGPIASKSEDTYGRWNFWHWHGKMGGSGKRQGIGMERGGMGGNGGKWGGNGGKRGEMRGNGGERGNCVFDSGSSNKIANVCHPVALEPAHAVSPKFPSPPPPLPIATHFPPVFPHVSPFPANSASQSSLAWTLSTPACAAGRERAEFQHLSMSGGGGGLTPPTPPLGPPPP